MKNVLKSNSLFKEAAVLSDWESQQSLHFSQIEDFDLMFNKD